jgi:hypothetical protein
MKIKAVIESIGLSVWIDDYEIGIGDSLARKIADGIGKCDYLIIIISKNSEVSGWVQKELDWAITKEIKDSAFKVLPVILDSTKLPSVIADKLYFQLKSNYSQLGLTIARTILSDNLLEKLPTEKVLNNFEIFHSTKENQKTAYLAIGIGAFLLVFSFYLKDLKYFMIILSTTFIAFGFYINYIFTEELKLLKSDKDILKKLEKIGPFKIPFSRKWSEQYLIALDDKGFKKIFYGETAIYLFMLIFLIAILILIALLSNYFKI